MCHSLSRSEIIQSLEAIINAQDENHWDKLESSIESIVTINKTPLQRDKFIAQLCSDVTDNNTSSKLDSFIVDVNAQAIAARVIKTQSISPEAQLVQYQEIMLAWFKDGRLSSIKSLQDNDARRAKEPSAAKTPGHLLDNANSTTIDLYSIYRDYIKSINSKTMEATFGRFCMICSSTKIPVGSLLDLNSLVFQPRLGPALNPVDRLSSFMNMSCIGLTTARFTGSGQLWIWIHIENNVALTIE